ncbi:unnamed protein product (macronuclear) [Paramecium tetraurelia]|uniref:Uncharacterized protein n=2 Tax=Paramecium TaxID=5884 RepID=A0EEY7_PARTE|nr:uncharacterized protein GSPATT00026201001 [Paramecium tetraurelia]CAD8189994.1 unnamed protein product [Paramecium octaurelia]CAK93878.1 unnamed protein product [Paramecium tetraurelia]|eukprot:XP_001461251.1 hypothetical protein (macronuclear) [Paramecium tetraurelia strain d4-2]
MNQALKYVPKIKFIGSRANQVSHQHVAQASKYVHKVVDYQRRKMTQEEIDIINQGGFADLSWKKIKPINI